MVETVLIILFSLALFVYWFRYTVILLLSEDREEKQGAVISQLSLSEMREVLRTAEGNLPLDRVHRALEKDYRMLRYLLDHAAGWGLAPLEHYLLILDYKMMAAWYHLTRSASSNQARRALEEMAAVIACIAYKMSERPLGTSEV
ncbi:MAG TPA: hypothetical protein VMT86_00545 [Bryobacteraceae bacterium]|nr:hypothetical protein [Bryobacteraceae bacterium]